PSKYCSIPRSALPSFGALATVCRHALAARDPIHGLLTLRDGGSALGGLGLGLGLAARAGLVLIGLLARLSARLLAGERGREGLHVALLPAQIGERLPAAVVGLGEERERLGPLGLGVRRLARVLADGEHHHHRRADLRGAIDLAPLDGGLAAH